MWASHGVTHGGPTWGAVNEAVTRGKVAPPELEPSRNGGTEPGYAVLLRPAGVLTPGVVLLRPPTGARGVLSLWPVELLGEFDCS
jgi:hypothetical protein